MMVYPAVARGKVQAPPSKSVTHRAYLLAAQSEVPCTVVRPLRGADTNATLACLLAMDARYDLMPNDIRFEPAEIGPPRRTLDCANSGTTLRLLSATCARFNQATTLDGDMSLRSRPNQALLSVLATLGCAIESSGGKAPLTVRGPIRGGQAFLPADASSQFATALLLSMPFVPGTSTVFMQKPVASRPYVELTLETMRAFRLDVTAEEDDRWWRFDVLGGQVPRAKVLHVSGDWSGAAFPLAAAAITGGDITVTGIDSRDTQGDRAIIQHLQAFGAKATHARDWVRIIGQPLQSPGAVDVRATPDLFPILCVVAACAQGTTTITGSKQLRFKESDRIHAMAEGLAAVGVSVVELPEGLRISGGGLRGGVVKAKEDHRIHMAFAVAGLASTKGILVDGDDSARVSYPGFHDDLRRVAIREDIPTTLL